MEGQGRDFRFWAPQGPCHSAYVKVTGPSEGDNTSGTADYGSIDRHVSAADRPTASSSPVLAPDRKSAFLWICV